MLPPDWQERMAAVIRGVAEPDPTWFTSGPVLSPREQIGVYQQQYRLRMWDALVEEVPGLRWLLGDRAEPVLWRYLHDCPPCSWTLNRIADRLPGWLRQQSEDQVSVDMASLDVAVAGAFEAADGAPLTAAMLASLPPLRLAPPVRLLRLTGAVHLARSALLEGREVAPIERREVWLVVFRRSLGVRHLELDEGAWRLLAAIGEGAALGDALEAVSPSDLGQVTGWFQLFAEAGLVQVDEKG